MKATIGKNIPFSASWAFTSQHCLKSGYGHQFPLFKKLRMQINQEVIVQSAI
jgi:hypothetical protein